MAAATVTSVFTVCALWFMIVPPEGLTQVALAAAGVLVAGSAVSAATLIGHRGAGLVLLATPVAVTWGLATIQEGSGLSGWWPATSAGAVAALVCCGVATPTPAAVTAQALILLAVIYPHVSMGDAFEAGPALLAYRILPLVVVAILTVGLGMVTRRTAAQIDAAEREAQLRLSDEADRGFDAARDDAIRQVWHDTALNTLETVARSVPEASWPSLRERCRHDLDCVTTAGTDGSLVDALRATATDLDLVLTIEAVVQAQPPGAVTAALTAATQEALRNVAKHAGVREVVVRASLASDLALVQVSDRGTGARTSASGMGSRLSMQKGLAAVGGRVEMDSAAGAGTTVNFIWEAAQARADQVMKELRRGLFVLLVGLVFVTLGVWLWLTALDSGLAERDLRVAVLVVTAGVCALLLGAVRRGAEPGRPVAIVAVSGAVVVTAMLPLSDVFCASVQRTSSADPRLLVLVCFAVAFRRFRVVLLASVAVLVCSVLSAWLWSVIVPGCGSDYVMTALITVCLTASAFLFSRMLEQQRVRIDRAAYLRSLEMVHRGGQRARVHGLTQWSTAASLTAVELLRDIESGRANSEQLRQQAAGCATRLRAQLLVLGHPGPVLEVLRDASLCDSVQLVIDGDPAVIAPGTPAAAEELRRWLPTSGRVDVTVSRIADTGSLLAHTATPGQSGEHGWTDADGRWLHLECEASPAATLAEEVRGIT